MQNLATAVGVAVLLASVYFGLSNAKDILNTITVWQRPAPPKHFQLITSGGAAHACGLTGC